MWHLEGRGLIERTKKFVAIGDWKGLADEAGFDDTYLHLRDPGMLLATPI
jgi:hypothetical protein